MADVKISELPAATTINPTDFFVLVDMSGAPTTRRTFASNLGVLAPVQSVAGKTGSVSLAAADITDFAAAVSAAAPVKSNISATPGGTAITNILAMTQADYDALVFKNASTLYIIVPPAASSSSSSST